MGFERGLRHATGLSPPSRGEGLVYRPNFLSEGEEGALLDELEPLDLREITMRGQTVKRTTRHFGYDFD